MGENAVGTIAEGGDVSRVYQSYITGRAAAAAGAAETETEGVAGTDGASDAESAGTAAATDALGHDSVSFITVGDDRCGIGKKNQSAAATGSGAAAEA